MITISGTTVLEQTPKGGPSVELMTSLLRAREAADTCYVLAEQAKKDGRHAFLAGFWSEIAERHMEVVRLTTAAVARLRDESQACQPDEGGSALGEPKTGAQRTKDPKGRAS